ncbi:MAG: hypothetical protein H6657_15095 [Ardenticatenaceae bacterium]|nr:hypothetical protein [Ardenticatenaceae bacterium]
MMEKRPLSLSQPITYRIKVPGHLDASVLDWVGAMTFVAKFDEDGLPITLLTGLLDQAALQGILRRLYALGLPLISVSSVKDEVSQGFGSDK